MTNSLIQVLKEIVVKEIENTATVVQSKELIISKEKEIVVINLGKLSS